MRRYLLYFTVLVAITLVPAALLSWLFEPINGDLTRIGHYSERDFGWNSTQPAVLLRENGVAIVAPDILVLGDSFSRENGWQSALGVKLNKPILSFHYAQVGCIKNWIEYALNQSSADTVAIQVVERDFVSRFSDLPPCESATPSPLEKTPRTSPATRSTWPPELHILRTYRIAINTLRMNLNPDSALRGSAINAPIRQQCAKFSNRRSDRILYYPDDENKLQWKQDDMTRSISNVIRIQKLFAARGKTLIFIIAPDKLSVYQDCLINDPDGVARKRINVTKSLIQAGGNAPDLLHAFQENSGKVVDLYYPNNTHLSTSGYMFMAEKLAPFFTEKPATTPTSH